MQISEPKNPKKRHPLWSREEYERLLRESSLTNRQICEMYSGEGGWRACYGDTVRWRRESPELDSVAKEHFRLTDSKNRTTFGGGRPSKELDAPDWRMQYCERLAETKNRSTACEVTPYTYDEIYKKLNPKYSEFDKDFAEMVHAVEMRFLANAEEVMYTAMDHEPSWRNKAWIAKEILKVRDRDRWSDKLDISVEHKGVVRFEANRQKMLAELAEEQHSSLPAARRELTAGEPSYIDVEVVQEKVSE